MPLGRLYLTVMRMKPKNLSKAREHVKHWQYFDAINDILSSFLAFHISLSLEMEITKAMKTGRA